MVFGNVKNGNFKRFNLKTKIGCLKWQENFFSKNKQKLVAESGKNNNFILKIIVYF